MGTYQFGRNPKAWIMTIARNTSINVWNKAKKEISNEFCFEECDTVSVPVEVQVTDRLALDQALNVLTAQEREVFVMHYAGDLTYSSISKIMNLSLSAVSRLCTSARKKVKSCLQQKSEKGGVKYEHKKAIQ